VVFGVVAGVGALTGVRGFSAAFHGALHREARAIIAADLTLRQFAAPSGAQIEALEPWLRRGARSTRITETVSMLSAGQGSVPVLVSVKAVEPAVYPFYGKVKLDPDRPLSEALTAATVAVSDDLPVRLGLSTGSSVRLGSADFTVAGVVRLEPDRVTGSLNIGPRVLIAREGLERTGLVVFGSRASHRLLFRLPPEGIDIAEMRAALKKAFPEALIAGYREGHPFLARALERSTTFLSLVSLIALIVGALGVATAIHSHLQQRLDTIAILKCLGARSAQIIRIYTLQTMLIGLAGGVCGVGVGAAVQKVFPALLAKYFQLGDIPWNPSFALEGIAAGILVTLLFTLPPLAAIRQVKPALIFRREMANLYRPGNHAPSVLVARADLQAKPRLTPIVPARLLLVNGQPLEEFTPRGERRRAQFTRQVTWAEPKPEDLRVRRGRWWKEGESAALVSVSEGTAARLKLEPGVTLR
jgi:putative ABC transport system permease protein